MARAMLFAATLVVSMLGVNSAFAQDTALSETATSVLEVSVKFDLLLIGFSAILVFLMQAGFALLESGMIRSKNTVNVMMKNYVDVCVVMIVFWIFGYGLMWGNNTTGFIGTSKFLYDPDDPQELMHMFYQVMFAATCATIISGALAERMNFVSYVIISVLVSAVVYPIFGSWVWGEGGWLKEAGYIDFAGSSVVHGIGGWSAMAAAIILGPRLGRFSKDGIVRPILGHNLGLVALSGFLLWFGWFGFNMGSSGTVDGSIPRILFNTNIAGAAGGLAGVVTMALIGAPILLTTTIAASIGGLVAITAGAATLSIPFALLTGAIGGIIAVVGIRALERMHIDDAVGAIPCHAFAGFWGTVAAGLFYQGDLFNLDRVVVQLMGAVSCMLWGFLAAFLIFKVVDLMIGLRVDSGHERQGLDFSEHYEIAYPEFKREMINPGKRGG